MHDNSPLVERRIRRELLERVLPAVYSASAPMQVTAWEAPGEPVPFSEAIAALAAHGRPFAIGERWGRPWGTTWFQFDGEPPASRAGDGSHAGLEAVIDLGFHLLAACGSRPT